MLINPQLRAEGRAPKSRIRNRKRWGDQFNPRTFWLKCTVKLELLPTHVLNPSLARFLFQLIMRRKRAGARKGKGNPERKGQDSMCYLHGSMLLFRFANVTNHTSRDSALGSG